MNRTGSIRLSVVFEAVAIICVAIVGYTQYNSRLTSERTAACANRLEQIGLSITQYAQDYDETLPCAWYGRNPGASNALNYKWMDAIYPYAYNVPFACPSDKISKPYKNPPAGTNYGSYVMNNAYYAQGDKCTPPAGQPLSKIEDTSTILAMDGENDFQFAWSDPTHAPSLAARNGLRLESIVARHKGTPYMIPMTLWVDGSVHGNSLQSVAAEKVIHGQGIYTGFTIERD